MTKRFKYLIALNVLLLGMVAISLQYSRKQSTLGIDAQSFAMPDTASITNMQIGGLSLVKKAPEVWVINERYLADAKRMQALMGILAKLEIKKPVPSSLTAQVQDSLRKGFSLTTFYGGQVMKNLRVGAHKGETYMQQDGADAFAVYAPGYRTPLAAWLSQPIEEWRDKRIFATSFKTLKELNIAQAGTPQLDIAFAKDFYEVKNVAQLDSMKLYQYLVLCADIPCEAFLPQIKKGEGPLSGKPIYTLSLSDISFEQPQVLEVYESQGNFYGWRGTDAMLLHPKAVQALMVKPDFFMRKTP